jgi:hypothetical protein
MSFKSFDMSSVNCKLKCRVTDAADDCPQNSSEVPSSKTIQITGSPETSRDKQLRSKFAAHMCAQILEHDNFLSHIVFTDEAKLHISVSFGAVSLPQNI